MTKNEWISLLKNSLLQVDKTAKYHNKVIEAYCDVIFNELVYDTYRRDISDIDRFTKTYNGVSVSKDATTKLYYSTLPAKTLQLPRTGGGVMEVSTVTDYDIEFVPIRLAEYELLHSTDVDTEDGIIPFVLLNNTIEYRGDMTGITSVRLRLVIPFSAYSGTDEVYIPAARYQFFTENVKTKLGVIPPKDLRVDNSDLKK